MQIIATRFAVVARSTSRLARTALLCSAKRIRAVPIVIQAPSAVSSFPKSKTTLTSISFPAPIPIFVPTVTATRSFPKSIPISRTASSFPNLIKMDFAGVKRALGEGSVVLLDVRKPEELQSDGKIPGAKNVPLSDVESAFQLGEGDFSARFGFAKPGKDAAIVTHCLKGGRASKAADALKAMGFNNVQVYAGSFTDWKANGGPVEKP